MANKRIQGITIKIGGDATELGDALKETEKKSQSVKAELREVGYSLRSNGESAVLWQQKQELLTKAIEESREKVKILEQAQDQIKEKFLNGGIDDGQYRAFQRELENARGELKRLGEQLEEGGKQAENLGDDIHKSGEQAQDSADGGFTVLKGVIANLASDTLKAAADAFKELASEGEEALNTIQTRTGATAEEMQQYSEVMSNLYANNFGDDKADLAESISSVKQQLGELSPEELEKITERAILMRDTFGYDVAESIRTVKMLMDQFEVSAGEAYTLIAQGSQKGLDKNGDLLDTLNEYSVHYKSIGYSAEEFFNSLMNGTEAGTFSVDKLGDTVKEFSIRQKEGADETVAAWATLGLVQADNSEFIKATTDCIADQRDKIEELEKKLKYAYVEQSNFNSETDELKKMKMADSIAEWEQELSELQGSLAVNEDSLRSIQNAGSDAKYTAEELMSAFNSGGDEAQKATEDIINALFALEDETLKNQLGVQLFGTMWEDLGKVGVSALMDVSGEADKTASTLEDINKVKYDDAQSQFEQLKRKIITDLLEPAAQKFIPKIEDGADWLVKNLPKIVDTGKKLIPIVTGIGGAFAMWKVSTKAISGVEKLFTAVKSGNSVMKLFNATLKANPAVAVGAAIVGVTAALTALSKTHKDEETIAQRVAKEYEEAHDKVTALQSSVNGLKDNFNSRASDIDSETERTKNLWKELDNLADSSGKVQDKDKIRTDYILGELNEALGTEYMMTGNQIENYRIMKQEIDDLIEKKKAMSYIDSYSEQSAEYAKQRAEAYAGYTSSRASYDEYNRQMRALADEFTRLTGEKGDYTTLNTQIDSWEQNNIPVSEKGGDLYNALMSLQSEYNTALANRAENAQLMGEYKKVYNEASEYLNRLEDAERALAEGRYKDVEDYLYDVKDTNREILKDGSKTDGERQKAFDRSLNECLAGLDLVLKSGRKEAVASAIETMGEIVKEGKAGGGTVSKEFLDEFKQNVNEMLNAGFDIAELAEWAKESGIKVADAFDEDFYKVVQEQLDAGYDIRDLLVWGEASGYKIGDYFVEDFKDKVQEALDKGYKINNLLEWAKESGYFIGDETQYELMKKIQENLDLGFNTDRLIDWAIENGITLGQLFGENFSYYAEQAFWADWNTNGIQSIQSASDEALYYAGRYGIGDKSNLKYRNPDTGEDYYAKDHPDWVEYYYNNPHPPRFFANGGFLGSGQGIVAEAGPELIEIMNGGARITPLTGTARNTAVSGAGGSGVQKNFYSSYTVNATIAGKYDVTRLAEDLEMERRRIESGRGL